MQQQNSIIAGELKAVVTSIEVKAVVAAAVAVGSRIEVEVKAVAVVIAAE